MLNSSTIILHPRNNKFIISVQQKKPKYNEFSSSWQK